jgi:hypothetical protein
MTRSKRKPLAADEVKGLPETPFAPGMVDGHVVTMTEEEYVRARIARDVAEAMDEEPAGDVEDVSDAEDYE